MQPKMIHYICEKYAVTSDIPVTVFSEGRAEESFLAFPHAPETGMFPAPVHTLLSQRGGANYLLTAAAPVRRIQPCTHRKGGDPFVAARL